MKRTLSLILMTLALMPAAMAKVYKVTSPDGRMQVEVTVNEALSYRVLKDNQEILAPSPISMTVNDNKVWGKKARVQRVHQKHINETITPVVPRKYNQIQNTCQEMDMAFRGGYHLIIRAYDEGMAYRWKSTLKGELKVNSEVATFNFPKDHKIWFPEEESMYSHQERKYPYISLSEITPKRFCSTGTLVDLENGKKAYISESDLEEYPGLFLKGNPENNFGLVGKFAGFPLETKQTSDRDVPVTKHADFLAKTTGNRSFPWRVMIVTDADKELVQSELIYKLAKPLQIKNPSWIKPGKVAWDWWNALNIYGVDFKSGVNTATYKYFIDFAADNKLEYIILDEGWYHLEDVMKIKKEVDLPEILRYGKEKNVGIILWVTWKALDDKLEEALEAFEKWGVKGIKVDFMQRDDQWMVNYYHKVAKLAAKHHLLVDYHGAYKPAGLRRAYPNVITREGIFGMEQCKWCDKADPDHNLTLPFIRMVAGPMDFTPGAMLNANKKNFRAVWSEPMSQGTRCHQLAMYVVYESPLQMLSDNPSNYRKEKECMEFLSPVPSVWDDTKVLDGKVSDYILMARQSGDTWYMGAMTDWDERELTTSFDFLPKGEYTIEIWQDGINANTHAADFKKVTKSITSKSQMTIKMASGGGWVAIIRPKK